MPYFVYAVIPATMQQHTPHAYVTGNITEGQYAQTYGMSPANAGIPGQTNAGFATRAGAQAAANTFNKNPGPPLGGVNAPSVFPKVGSNPLTGLAAIGDFFSRLEQPDTWIRVGEVITGFILLYVGAKAFFPQTVNTVTSTVKRAVKTAAFL